MDRKTGDLVLENWQGSSNLSRDPAEFYLRLGLIRVWAEFEGP